ncbi:hypothetical protein PBY51_015557 [Eleginops maclovinus]|uniref:Uncharacterized protein n=1 Tax=Eleginops maclovinus TaxID=56733 RepID=A0AAN7XLH2_ELEMC|nr:hypothetical protein PBY51_015557 [Eleginops maclovinus]
MDAGQVPSQSICALVPLSVDTLASVLWRRVRTHPGEQFLNHSHALLSTKHQHEKSNHSAPWRRRSSSATHVKPTLILSIDLSTADVLSMSGKQEGRRQYQRQSK